MILTLKNIHMFNNVVLPRVAATKFLGISTTNLAACVCVSSKFDQFLPARSYFVSKRPENFVRIAKFPYAAFGPLFAFHCPLFFTRNNHLQCKSLRHTPVQMHFSRADGIVCARTIDASPMNGLEGWAHCGHPSKRDCRQGAGT